MEKIIKLIKTHYAITLFILIYSSILFYKVISLPTPFFDWDESIYIEVGKEMVSQKSLIPLYQGIAWLEKPPLAPLLYGVVQILPINPEISTRVFSILLSLAALLLIYSWILKTTKTKFFAFVATVFTAFNPVFFQRAQIVNTDVFLLIGWLGYFLFFPRFWISLIFLAIGVMSKSLLGFYPALIVMVFQVYQLLTTKDKKKALLDIKMILLQISILLIWYVGMLIMFGKTFIEVHFSDHLIKRVTKSIESHFGQRTFYLDIVFMQYGFFSFLSLVSLCILTWQFLKKKIEPYTYLLSLALAPWFIFLNLTKTKIEWYIYPAVSEITFLILYPITLLKKIKPLFYVMLIVIVGLYIYSNFSTLYTARYSSYDDNYKIATAANKNCRTLSILVDSNDRKNHDVLKDLNLLISTSDSYGPHPAMIYYFGKKVTPYYQEKQFENAIPSLASNECISIEEKDIDMLKQRPEFKKIIKFNTFYLFKKS